MKNILLIATLCTLWLAPYQLMGAERYAVQDTSTITELINAADSIRYQKLEIENAQKLLRKALKVSSELNHYREARIRKNLAYNLAQKGELDSAITEYKELFEFCKQQKDFESLADGYYSAGMSFKQIGRYQEAEHFLSLSIATADKHQFFKSECKYLRMLSDMYVRIGKHGDAVIFAEKAMALAKKIDDPKEIASSSMVIGNLFIDAKDYTNAKFYFQEHFNYALKHNDTLELARANVNLGSAYYFEDKNDSALIYYLRAVSYYDIAGKKAISTAPRYNVSAIYYLMDSIPQFLKYLNETEEIHKATSNFIGLLDVMYLRADYFRDSNMDKESIALSREAIQLCIKAENMQSRLEFYDDLATTYQKIGLLDSSLFYNRAYLALNDSIYTKEFQDELISADMENRYHAKEREKEIEVLQLLNDKRLYLLWGMGILIALTLIIALISIRSLNHKRNLAVTRLELHEQQIEKLLNDQELKSITAMMEGQDKERKRIAQDLHDRLGSMLSTVKHHFSAMESRITELRDQNVDQYHKAITLLDDAVREVRHISHDMLSGTLVKFGLVAALEDLKNTIKVPGKLEVEVNAFGLEERLENETEIAVYRIVQELVGNALKHAKASELNIQLTLSKDNLNVMVDDNGKGFDTDNIQSSGIGLANIKERIARLNGTHHLDSKIGRGTTFVFDIPIKQS